MKEIKEIEMVVELFDQMVRHKGMFTACPDCHRVG